MKKCNVGLQNCVDISYLPPTGNLFVDVRGSKWIDNELREQSGLCRNIVLTRRLNTINRYLKLRSDLSLTSREDLLFIEGEISFFDGKLRTLEQKNRSVREEGHYRYVKPKNRNYKNNLKNVIKSWRRHHDLLKSGLIMYEDKLCETAVDSLEVLDFLKSYDQKNLLDRRARTLIKSALIAGDNSGIFSDKYAVLDVYRTGVRRFGLEDCFISSARKQKTKWIQ